MLSFRNCSHVGWSYFKKLLTPEYKNTKPLNTNYLQWQPSYPFQSHESHSVCPRLGTWTHHLTDNHHLSALFPVNIRANLNNEISTLPIWFIMCEKDILMNLWYNFRAIRQSGFWHNVSKSFCLLAMLWRIYNDHPIRYDLLVLGGLVDLLTMP